MRSTKELTRFGVVRLLNKYGSDNKVHIHTGRSRHLFRINRKRHRIPAGSPAGRKGFKITKTRLRDLARVKTVKEIAEMFGVTQTTIYNYLKIYNIKPITQKRRFKIYKTHLRQLRRKHSVREISEIYGVSISTIYNVMKKYELMN